MDISQVKETLRTRLMEQPVRITAGVLIKCTTTSRLLLLLRPIGGENGNTWNLLSGGIERGETTLDGLKREVNEELSIDPNIIDYKYIGKEEVTRKNMLFHYYQGFTLSEFIPTLDHENRDYGWFTKDDLPSPLFPNAIFKINNI